MRQLRRTARAALLTLSATLVTHGLGAAQMASPEESVPEDVVAFTQAFQDAVRAYDVDAWADMVSEDVVMMAPNGRVVEGREAFHGLWSRSFEGASGPNPLSLRIQDVRGSHEMVAVSLDYGPEGAAPVGRYVWLLTRTPDEGLVLDWWIFTSGG